MNLSEPIDVHSEADDYVQPHREDKPTVLAIVAALCLCALMIGATAKILLVWFT